MRRREIHWPSGERFRRCRHGYPASDSVRDGQMLAIGQQNGIAIYDPASGKEVHPFKPTPAPVPSCGLSP